MKIWFAWKWWAGKTTLSSLVIQKLAQHKDILALDLDSNVNLATALWMEKDLDKLISFWSKKHEVMNYTNSTSMTDWEERIYSPKENDGFYHYNHDFVEKHSLKIWNIKAMSLGFIDDEKRWMESMCDYYEMSKVFLNHMNLNENEILVADLAAGIEMISRGTIMSFDIIFVVTDANFKNIKVSKQILENLSIINFEKKEIAIIPNKYLDEEDLENIKNHFSKYNILEGIAFNEELYDLDSKKELNFENINQLDEVVNNIANYILNYKRKSKEEITKRIEFFDTKKREFLQ